jgi:hypothetical protein
MKLTGKHTIAMLVTLLAVIGATLASAQLLGFRGPLVVRMTGTVQPFDEKKANDLNMLTLDVEGKQKWLYNVTRVDTVTGTDPGMMLLSRIFPPQLQVSGSPKILGPLETSAAAGKTVTLEGFLYIGDRLFFPGTVTVAASPAQ